MKIVKKCKHKQKQNRILYKRNNWSLQNIRETIKEKVTLYVSLKTVQKENYAAVQIFIKTRCWAHSHFVNPRSNTHSHSHTIVWINGCASAVGNLHSSVKHLLLHCRGCWKAEWKRMFFFSLRVRLDAGRSYFTINGVEAEVRSPDRQTMFEAHLPIAST